MPRDGSGVYTLPAGTSVSANTTIESSWANTLTSDLQQDANTARPVVAGGTGSTTASAARTALGAAGLADANTFTANQTITSTDAGATAAPVLDLYRNSASPAASDILGKVLFNGEDSAGNTQEYGSIEAVIDDPTSTSEDGSLDFYATVAGARTKVISVGPNLDLEAVGQIKFPATANPSSNANTLDDYEEGTFTATLTCGTSGTITLSSAACTYVKVGRLVHIEGELEVGSVSSPNGLLILGTFPFTSGGSPRAMSLYMSGFVGAAGITWQGNMATSATTANINFYSSSTGTVGGNPSGLMQAGTNIQFSIDYFASA